MSDSDAAVKEASDETADEPTDEQLIAFVMAGDERAFEQLFNRYRLAVARMAGRFFNRREQIEEIIQETFTKVYFALPQYKGRLEKSFVAWLMSIAVNACYDELRRARRRPETSHSDLSEAEVASLHQALNQKLPANAESVTISRDLANKLLARLATEDRLVLTLLNIEELSAAEIAKLTGWSVAKVKVRAHRARARLRRILSKLL